MKTTNPINQKLTKLITGRKLLLSDKYKLTCPRCTSKMKKVNKDDIVIDVCPHCGGIFLDDGEIDKLNELAKKTTTKKTKK